jgi:hypothetical protein
MNIDELTFTQNESLCFTYTDQRVYFVFRTGELVAAFELARLLTINEKDKPTAARINTISKGELSKSKKQGNS